MKNGTQLLTAWHRLMPAGIRLPSPNVRFPGSEIRTPQEIDSLVSAVANAQKKKFRKVLDATSFEHYVRAKDSSRNFWETVQKDLTEVVPEDAGLFEGRDRIQSMRTYSPAEDHMANLLIGFDAHLGKKPRGGVPKPLEGLESDDYSAAMDKRIRALERDVKVGLATEEAARAVLSKLVRRKNLDGQEVFYPSLQQYCRLLGIVDYMGHKEIHSILFDKAVMKQLATHIKFHHSVASFMRFITHTISALSFEEKASFLSQFLLYRISARSLFAGYHSLDVSNSIIYLMGIVRSWGGVKEVPEGVVPYLESPDGRREYIFNASAIFLARKLQTVAAGEKGQLSKETSTRMEQLLASKSGMEKERLWSAFSKALLLQVPDHIRDAWLARYAWARPELEPQFVLDPSKTK